ncbi:MAG TPA: hypothetical protein VD884_01060 [Ohtaekwangia sp.]|nr:hypothetical protein [Ohtaekwangia sp.]
MDLKIGLDTGFKIFYIEKYIIFILEIDCGKGWRLKSLQLPSSVALFDSTHRHKGECQKHLIHILIYQSSSTEVPVFLSINCNLSVNALSSNPSVFGLHQS